MKRVRDAGAITLSLLVGMTFALLGWALLRQLTASSLEELVLDGNTTGDRWTVALVFRAKECPGKMALLDQLNEITGTGLRVQGLLVADPTEFPDWEDLVTANQIAFPVRRASPEPVERALGSIPTPALVVFDTKGHLRLLTTLTDSHLTSDILSLVHTLSTRSPGGS